MYCINQCISLLTHGLRARYKRGREEEGTSWRQFFFHETLEKITISANRGPHEGTRLGVGSFSPLALFASCFSFVSQAHIHHTHIQHTTHYNPLIQHFPGMPADPCRSHHHHHSPNRSFNNHISQRALSLLASTATQHPSNVTHIGLYRRQYVMT